MPLLFFLNLLRRDCLTANWSYDGNREEALGENTENHRELVTVTQEELLLPTAGQLVAHRPPPRLPGFAQGWLSCSRALHRPARQLSRSVGDAVSFREHVCGRVLSMGWLPNDVRSGTIIYWVDVISQGQFRLVVQRLQAVVKFLVQTGGFFVSAA